MRQGTRTESSSYRVCPKPAREYKPEPGALSAGGRFRKFAPRGGSSPKDIMESAEPMEELLRCDWGLCMPLWKFKCLGGGPPVTALAAARAVAAALSSLRF